MSFPYRSHPCSECPWRCDTEPGQFSAKRYVALAGTSGTRGNETPLGAPMFGCHKSSDGKEQACAGWLAAVGYEHLTVRLAVIQGDLPSEALRPGEDWPPLFESYKDMAEAMGRKEGY